MQPALTVFADVRSIKQFVLDEADEMLSRGFKDQIYDVFQNLPTTTQVILLSATMPAEVLEVSLQSCDLMEYSRVCDR